MFGVEGGLQEELLHQPWSHWAWGAKASKETQLQLPVGSFKVQLTPIFEDSVSHLGQIFRKIRYLVPPKEFKQLFWAQDLPILLHIPLIYFPGSNVSPRAPAHLPSLTNRSAQCTVIPTVRSEISSAQGFANVWLPFPCLHSSYRPCPHPTLAPAMLVSEVRLALTWFVYHQC